MEAITKKEVTVTLKLSEKEAMWLKGLMQNPLSTPEDEDMLDREMRESFWKALLPLTRSQP